jgi:hypothetical protein
MQVAKAFVKDMRVPCRAERDQAGRDRLTTTPHSASLQCATTAHAAHSRHEGDVRGDEGLGLIGCAHQPNDRISLRRRSMLDGMQLTENCEISSTFSFQFRSELFDLFEHIARLSNGTKSVFEAKYYKH